MENHQKKTAYDRILEIVAIAALLGSFYPLLFYNTIDPNALFPIHYNFAGEPDNWGGRSSLWVMPLIGLAFYIGMSILQKYPKIYNYPRKVTKKNANYLYRMGVQLIRHLKACFLLILAYSNIDMYIEAIGKNSNIAPIVYAVLIAVMFLPIVIYTVKMRRYKPKI
jgi:hypothetical protein